jgi:hypothetical protein
MNLKLFVMLAAAALLGYTAAPSAEAANLCQGIAIPAYFYPGTLWTTATSSTPRTSIMIMNPNSGPGTSQDANYVKAVTAAQAAGIKVLGYVSTRYGQRPVQEAVNNIYAYKTWYGVDGIFLDETRADAAGVSYYKALAKYIRGSKGGFVMLNPGVIPTEEYIRMADTSIVFEDSYTDYLGWAPVSWMYKYPAGKFTHLVYGTTGTQLANALTLSRNRNAGMIYITNDVLNNPWDTLPSYWSAKLSIMTSKCYP